MRTLNIKLLTLILGIAFVFTSCDKGKGSCEKDEHKSHHGKGHHNGGKKGGHFGKGHGPYSMNPDSMAKHRTERMAKELDLTNEQITKVEQVNLSYANKMKEIRSQMKNLEEERKKELAGILTAEQLEKLEQKRGRHKRAPMDSVQEEN